LIIRSYEERLRKLAEIFQEYDEVCCVCLFGSYIQGRVTPQSDLDFAILIRDQELFQDKILLAYRIEKALGFIAVGKENGDG
jgi:predicted nucleotidyltransferase